MLTQTEKDTLDRGPRSTAPGSERFCCVTRRTAPVSEMIRFVLDPDGRVVSDLKRQLPGRGVWITGTRQALRAAIARKVFGRSFKREVTIAPDLLNRTEWLMEQAALDALSMAHKAGKVVIGAAKAEAAIAREPVLAVLHAREAAPDGTRHFTAALRQRGDAGDVAVLETFASAQLDLALGRSNVVHAALLAGPESEAFLARAARLERFRTGDNQDRGRVSKTLEKRRVGNG